MTKHDLFDITLVLDRSGSMESVKTATIEAFNQFLVDQRSQPGRGVISLFQFDDEYDVVYAAKPVSEAPPLTTRSYQPRASTALLDAMGRGMNETGERLAAMPEHERPGTVLFVVLTDGLENASSHFTAKQINAMITEQRDKYGWQFLFLAANQDAIMTASQYGIGGGQALTYEASEEGMAACMDVLHRKMSKYRSERMEAQTRGSPAPVAMSFDETDRSEAIVKKGPPKPGAGPTKKGK